jgi:hypothetical protein
MKISELITLAEARLAVKNSARATAVQHGAVHLLAELDADIAETQRTLDALRAIPVS